MATEQAAVTEVFALLHTKIYEVSLLQNVMLTADACGIDTLTSDNDTRGL